MPAWTACARPVGRPAELARDWNRIVYVWPTVDAPLAELGIRSLAARTGALGLEQVMVQFRNADAPGAVLGCPGRRAPG